MDIAQGGKQATRASLPAVRRPGECFQDLEKSKSGLEVSRSDLEKSRNDLEKSRNHLEKSRNDLEKSRDAPGLPGQCQCRPEGMPVLEALSTLPWIHSRLL